jgi:hypothetical protein
MADVTVAMIVIFMGLGGAAVTVSWIWRTLEQSRAADHARLETFQQEIDDLRQQIHELREGRIADHALLQEWITYARRLAAMFRAATGQEPPMEPAEVLRPVSQVDIARLSRAIAGHFSAREVEGLAFDLGLGDVVAGDTPAELARALVDAARKRGILRRLLELYREQRPNGGY